VKRVLIFDLDGTLVDSRQDLHSAVNQALATLGLPAATAAQVQAAVGDGVAKLLERLIPDISASERRAAMAAFSRHYMMHCHDTTKPYPGIVSLLGQLRQDGWRLAVATNKPLVFTTLILDACALGPFAALRGGDGPRKPDPGQLLSILEELQAPAAESWMIGDHHTDILAGRAAGCRVLWCGWGMGHRDGLVVDAQALVPLDIRTQVGA
jgi:phosphoglycolate phosphatase